MIKRFWKLLFFGWFIFKTKDLYRFLYFYLLCGWLSLDHCNGHLRFSNLFIIAYFRHMYIVIVYLNSHYVKFLNIIIDQQNQRCKYDQSLLKNFFYIFCSKNYAKVKNTSFKSLGKNGAYTRCHKVAHPISKVLQWLAR